MILILYIIVPTLYMMVLTIILFGILYFYLLFKFNIYKKIDSINIIYDSTFITFDGTN